MWASSALGSGPVDRHFRPFRRGDVRTRSSCQAYGARGQLRREFFLIAFGDLPPGEAEVIKLRPRQNDAILRGPGIGAPEWPMGSTR